MSLISLITVNAKLDKSQFDAIMKGFDTAHNDALDIKTLLRQIILILTVVPATTTLSTDKGVINMAQTTYVGPAGTANWTFRTFDNATPPNEITAQCTYAISSLGTALTFGAVSGNTASSTAPAAGGTDTITLHTTDAGFDVPDVVLAATITPTPPPPPTPGATTMSVDVGTIS